MVRRRFHLDRVRRIVARGGRRVVRGVAVAGVRVRVVVFVVCPAALRTELARGEIEVVGRLDLGAVFDRCGFGRLGAGRIAVGLATGLAASWPRATAISPSRNSAAGWFGARCTMRR